METNNWSNGPSLSNKRRYHGCFSIKNNNMITEIVVMGGIGSVYLSSTEILDVNSMTWRNGPALPISVHGNRGVQSEVGPYPGFSIGGWSGRGQKTRKIFGLKKTPEDNFKWEEVHSMTTARASHSVVNAPKSLLPNCGKGNFDFFHISILSSPLINCYFLLD